ALRNGSQPYPLRTGVARERKDGGADFWTAVGGQYKASVDYVVTLSCQPGTSFERGPEVRTQTVRVREQELPSAPVELNRFGAVVCDAAGDPVVDAWILLRDVGWTTSDARGRFIFDRLPAGTYELLVRAADGSEATRKVTVPGQVRDIRLGRPKRSVTERQ